MTKLTEADVQRDLDAFAAGVEEVGPTVRAFQDALAMSSTSVAQYHLHRLEREGLIERSRNPYSPNGYRLTALGRERSQRESLTQDIRRAS